jgi:hypothetical protein
MVSHQAKEAITCCNTKATPAPATPKAVEIPLNLLLNVNKIKKRQEYNLQNYQF